MIKKILPLTFILIITIIVSRPLLKDGLYQIHDDQQVARLFAFDNALQDGQFPVRWVDDFGFGYGYPLFNFYPPLVYVIGETFHILGFGFVESIKIVFFLSLLFSGLTMYLFVRELLGKFPALISSIFYILIPYRAIDIYIRGALAESFSFVWIPIILWSFYKLSNSYKLKYIILCSIFLSLLMITHNLIFLAFIILFPIYYIFLLFNTENRPNYLIASLFSVILFLCLSAFFWLPSLFEKKYTIVDQLLLTALADYKIHFVYLKQLWHWPWGFAGSAEGLLDGISFKIGKLHILNSLTVMFIVFITITRKKFLSKDQKLTAYFSILFFILLLFSAFITTNYSKIIWDNFKSLAYLQFPWRYLLFTGVFSSILSGYLIYFLRLSILRLSFGIILIILLLITNTKLFKPQTYRDYFTDNFATSRDIINWEVSKSSFEYIPQGVKLLQDKRNIKMLDLNKADLPKQKIQVLNGNSNIKLISEKSHLLNFIVESKDITKIQVNYFNFPGWQVKVDGQQVKIEDNNNLKLINFEIPIGVHQVEVKFTNTNIRFYANLISVISIFFVVFILLKRWTIKPRQTI